MKRTALAFMALALCLGFSVKAFAYSRSIYGYIRFYDERNEYSNSTGSRLTSVDTNRALKYVAYYITARCGANYYYSGFKYATSGGYFSNTFASVSCQYPEYLVSVYYASEYDSTYWHWVTNSSNTLYATTIYDNGGWFQSTSEPSIVAVNTSCPDNYSGSCTGPGHADYNETSHRVSNVYITGTMVAEQWGAYQESSANRIYLRWPYGAAGSSSSGYDIANIGPNHWDNNHIVAHEVGHNIHRRAMGYSGSLAGGAGWCSPHDWNDSNGSETCAGSEGWAGFFAGATHFNDNSTEPFDRYCADMANCPGHLDHIDRRLEGDTWEDFGDSGSDSVECVAEGDASDHTMEGNMARFLWDVWDSTTATDDHGGYSDNQNLTPAEMLNIWESFLGHGGGEDEYGSRGYDEPHSDASTWDNEDGRNGYDYRMVSWYYADTQYSLYYTYMLNCLSGQQTDSP